MCCRLTHPSVLHPNPFRSVPIQWWCWCWCCRQGQRKHCSTGCRRWSRRRRRIPPRVRQAALWRARSFARHQVSRLSLVVMLLSLCLPLYVCSVVYSSIPWFSARSPSVSCFGVFVWLCCSLFCFVSLAVSEMQYSTVPDDGDGGYATLQYARVRLRAV